MTAVPAALDALVAAAAAALPRARIIDGPWLRQPTEPDVVVVGWTPSGEFGVEYVDAIAGLGSSRETFDVTGLASAWRGGTDITVARDRADEILEAIRARLAADPTLGGAVTRARLATLSLDQYQTEAGSQAAIEFVVRVDAFRSP